jgi:hypothetical protein
MKILSVIIARAAFVSAIVCWVHAMCIISNGV